MKCLHTGPYLVYTTQGNTHPSSHTFIREEEKKSVIWSGEYAPYHFTGRRRRI